MNPEVPAWVERELSYAGLTLEWMPWGPKVRVFPIQGYTFWRRSSRGEMMFGRWSDFGGEKVFYRYEEDHPEHGTQEFEAPARSITQGRLVVCQRPMGSPKLERLFDLVYDDCSPCAPDARMMTMMMNCKSYDVEQELSRAEKNEAAVKQKADDLAEDQMTGPLYDMYTKVFGLPTDAQRPVKEELAPGGFKVIDRRLNPVSHFPAEPVDGDQPAVV